jgi:hypothetical protein
VRRRRSPWVPVVTAAVVIGAGFGVALAEAFRLPKGSVWLVVGGAVLALVLVRVLERRRP